MPEGTDVLTVGPAGLVLSACKPAEDGDGFVLRLLNPTDAALAGTVDVLLPVDSVESVRLDETPDGADVRLDGGRVHLEVGPHALRSIRLRTAD